VTTSFDNKCKLWNSRDWTLLRTITGHENKVTSASISKDYKRVYTSGMDKKVMVWDMDDV